MASKIAADDNAKAKVDKLEELVTAELYPLDKLTTNKVDMGSLMNGIKALFSSKNASPFEGTYAAARDFSGELFKRLSEASEPIAEGASDLSGAVADQVRTTFLSWPQYIQDLVSIYFFCLVFKTFL